MGKASDFGVDTFRRGEIAPRAADGNSDQVSLAEFDLQVCGIALASMRKGRGPVAGKGVGSRIDGGNLRISLRFSANAALIEAVRHGAAIAATFSQPTTHHSQQFKSPSASIDEARAEDLIAAELQRKMFVEELVACNYSPDFAARYTAFAPHELIVLEFSPESVFDQTPGPSAGARLS